MADSPPGEQMSALNPNVVAFIPARSGSKRVPDKNIRVLNGHPLIAYTIKAALESNVFDAVVVSTDSQAYADIAGYYGAEVPGLRPAALASATSPDIDFVEYTLDDLRGSGRSFDCFSILRPTSPFRLPATIQRAWSEFRAVKGVDSLRAVELCKQHPGKMWVVRGERMTPLLPLTSSEQPWHSTQYAALPMVYVQNASLEIAWTRMVDEFRNIAGNVVMPFFTEGYEGCDINDPEDWRNAEHLVAQGIAPLPNIDVAPYATQ